MNLKSFLDKYGTETSNNFQLLHWAKQLKIKNFHVLMRDEISENYKIPVNIITIIIQVNKMVHIGALFILMKKGGLIHMVLLEDYSNF